MKDQYSNLPEQEGTALEELERRVRDLRVLKEFADTMLGHRGGIDEVLWSVAQQAVARMGLEDCVIYLVDDQRGDLVQCAAFGPKNPREREILNPIRIPIGRGIVGSVASSGLVELVRDTSRDPRYIEDDQSRLSELAVPIIADGRVIGVIDSEHSRRGFFNDWHRDLFVAVAAMASGRITAALLEAQRRRLATHDSLTGLLNRSELLRQLQQRLAAKSGAVAVIFIDLDHFGVFNDSISHLAGDELLHIVGERIRHSLSADAIAARFGGDEFVVVIPGELADAYRAALRIVAAISKTLETGAVAGLRVTCSAGVAAGDARNTADELIHNADLAMYEAKRSGRDQVCLHDASLSATRRREQRIVVELARAMERRDPAIQMRYQPVFRVADRVLVGAEALARWQHRDLGAIPPTEFIAAAERTGKIQALGRHILELVLQDAAEWLSLRSDFRINVNVSPLQLQHDGFAEDFLESLRKAGVSPERVACEVTESALLEDDRRAADAVRTLAAGGVHLALDDFGTGYASLATLTRHPFSAVKIDRSFVRNLAIDRSARTIVQTVITLAANLGLSCTAEGIEQQIDFDILRDMGCPHAQGLWLSAPLGPAELREMLLAR